MLGQGFDSDTNSVKTGAKWQLIVPIEARPSSGIGVRLPRALSWSGMAGKLTESSPKVDARDALEVLPAVQDGHVMIMLQQWAEPLRIFDTGFVGLYNLPEPT